MKKIKFSAGSSSPFFQSLNSAVQQQIIATPAFARARRLLWIKTVFYFALHISSYLLLFLHSGHEMSGLVLNYAFIGLSGLLLGFNVSHDACHESYGRNKTVNYLLYHLSFNMQGTNAFLWKIRHTASHHVFPNVDGCDADIDNNPFLRLSPQHPLKKYQRYQHFYSIIVYCIYTLHWFLFKDVLYLFRKRVANMTNKGYPLSEIILFIFWKLLYIFILVILPVLSGYTWPAVLTAFLVLHVINSLVFIHTLIATHLSMETQFPSTNENGALPYDYYTHQLATCLDYAPSSRICNFFLGGFNAHAAHHLYPRLPHTLYPAISVLIEQKAKEFNVPYNKLSWYKAICSHYSYLKLMGSGKAHIPDLQGQTTFSKIKPRILS